MVPGARLQLVAVVVPPLMRSPKAVAVVPTCTERLEGRTAEAREEGVVSMGGGMAPLRIPVNEVGPVHVSPTVSIKEPLPIIVFPVNVPFEVSVPLASKEPLMVLE